MCGLVGILTKNSNGFTAEQNDVFDTLLFVDQLRGEDSTGVFLVSNEGEVFVAKEATDATEFRKEKAYDHLLKRAFSNGAALIGHNRKATKGWITDENAHPFIVDDRIVLVHNGGVYGDHKKMADTEVDSHAIAHVINKHGNEVEAALNEIDAAYALIWFDVKEEKLHFVRNKARPLWYAETNSMFMWSSEKAMLDFAISRHKIITTTGPTEFDDDRLQTFTLNKRGYPLWKAQHQKLNIKPKGVSSGTVMFPTGQSCGYPTWGEAYGIECGDDGMWEQEGGSSRHPLERLPSESRTNVLQLPPPEITRGTPFVGAKIDQKRLDEALAARNMREYSGGTTRDNEIKMLKHLKKGVANQLFRQIYEPAYPYGSKVLATPFDYAYANTVNKNGGFYMYSQVVNDADVVVRHFWEEKYMNEDRLLKICSEGDHVYEFLIGTRQWLPFHNGSLNRQILPDEEGGILCISDKLTLLYGGGVGHEKYKPGNLEKTAPNPTVH